MATMAFYIKNLAEMVVYRHFPLHQTFILPKSWKFGLRGPQNRFFWTVFQDRMTVLRSFLAYLAKAGTPDGQKLVEMVVYRHFMLHQSFILPKSWKFGLIGHPNRVFGTVLHDRNDCF